VILLELLIVSWLPGAALFRLPFGERDKRAGLDAEERVFWAIIVSVVVSTALVLALAAASRYTFERLLMADVAVAGLAAVLARFDLRLGRGARRAGWSAALPLALVLLGLWRFFPSSEYVVGGKDPGTYISEGVQIAQRGSLVVKDPVVATVPDFARPLFFPLSTQPSVYSLRFMGFFIRNPDSGAVIGQFPQFFPASIAIGYGLDGLSGARRTVGVWAILGVLAVYFAGSRLVGRAAAWAAAALLALHVVEVWFARYPNAEVVMQAMLFASLLANARAHVDGDRFFAPVAGSLLGLLLFVRFDAVLGIAAVAASVMLGVAVGGRLQWSFVAALAATAGLSLVYLSGLMRAYADLPVIFVSNLTVLQISALGGAVLLAFATIAAGMKVPLVRTAIRALVPAALVGGVVVGAIYALYVRGPVFRELAARDADALRTFTSFYLTFPALIAGVVGFGLLARRAFWRAPDLFLTVAVFSFFFFYKIRIASDHFWMARRFLPVILPGALLFASAAALSSSEGGPRALRLARRAIGTAFVALLAIVYARAARPILPHVEYAGVIPRLESVARTLGDRDLLVLESRNASDTHVLGVPLAYIYDRPVIMLASPVPDKLMFEAFLDWARTHYDRVLFMGGGGTDLLSTAWEAKPVATERFQIPEYDAPVDAYPKVVRQKEFDFSIYELTRPDAENASREVDLDVGAYDDLQVVRFHAKEVTGGRTFRWSRNLSYIGLTNVHQESREVVLWLSDGGRPATAGNADLAVTLDDTPLGSVRVTNGFKPYTLAIPPALARAIGAKGRPVQLKLTTPVWIPQQVLGTPDSRDLGVMIDRVAIK
jgi:hypothetical protein